jgi:hypothetical protein
VRAMPRKMMEVSLFFRTKERKTSFEMDGWRCSRLEGKEYKAVDREDVRQRAMETGCWGGQGSPCAVAPRGTKEGTYNTTQQLQYTVITIYNN